MEAKIEVRGLRKSFGRTLALDGMTFTVTPGQVTGFIGPNGAGKTTTMRGFLRSLAAAGRAVLVSSHLMSELEGTADHLVIVGRGKVLADTSTRDLLAAVSGDRVTLCTTAPDRAAAALALAGATATTDG